MESNTTVPRLILASASPRRRELLRQIDIEAEVMPLDVPEEDVDPEELRRSGIHHDDLAGEVSLRRARMKYAVALSTLSAPFGNGSSAPGIDSDAIVLLCADTVVFRGGEVLDKPVDREDARRMLNALAGGVHTVSTAVLVAAFPGSRSLPLEQVVETQVTFEALSPDEIDRYLATEEWQGVAGAYRIQGRAAAFISHIEGSYSAVMGLPIHTVYTMIRRFSNRF